MGALTRIQVVEAAVKQAGRGPEMNAQAKILLNALLRSQALSNKYRCLRKVGSALTLSIGTSSVALPVDFGAGAEMLLFGDEKKEMLELDTVEFARNNGFPIAGQAAGRPTFFYSDTADQLFRFNAVADTAYSFIPIYYRVPENLSLDDADDPDRLWYEDDHAIIQGLIWMIYQYTDDVREPGQFKLFDQLDAKYRRGTMPKSGASQRLQLSSGAFRIRPRR